MTSTASSTRPRRTWPSWRPRCGWPGCSRSPRCATREVELDAAAVGGALAAIRNQLDAIRGLKMQLTTIGTAAREVNGGPRPHARERAASVAEAEAALRAAGCRLQGRVTAAPAAAVTA